MTLDCKLLIRQVKARPALWDREDQDYCHKMIVSKLWAEIALIHGVHESKVKSKWKALRDTFRQELKKNARKSPWNHFTDMQFLKPQFKTLPLTGKPESENDFGNISIVNREIYTAKYNEESEGDDMDAEAEVDRHPAMIETNDDDYHFLMSLLPEMRKVEPLQKLNLRIRIMELFHQVIYENS